MPKAPDKDTYIDFWDPRIGHKSASYMWWSKMVVASAPKVVLADVVLVLLAVKLNFSFALSLAWIMGTAGVGFLLTSLVAALMSHRSASKLLRIKVNSKTFPPVDDSSYWTWCPCEARGT
jgi:hypothetical protein